MEIHANDLIAGLVQKGHKLVVISSFHPENKQKIIVNDRLIYYFVGGNTLKSYKEFMENSAIHYESLIKTEKFDLLYSESDFAMGLIKYCKLEIPLVVLHHGYYMDEVKTRFFRGDFKGKLSSLLFYFKFIFNRWEKELLKQCNRLIVINKNNFNDFEKGYPFLHGKIRLIYNGINIERFRPQITSNLRSELNITTEKVLLFTGRVDKEKGIHIIMDVFQKVLVEFPDAKLLVTGEGAMKSSLVEFVKRNHLETSAIVLGKVPYERLPEYYSLAKIFLFPTLRYEGLPYNVIEAMACGCVVVASNRGGLGSIIESGHNGILIEPSDKRSVLDAIRKVFMDSAYADELSKKARVFAENNFSLQKMIDSTESVFFEATQNSSNQK